MRKAILFLAFLALSFAYEEMGGMPEGGYFLKEIDAGDAASDLLTLSMSGNEFRGSFLCCSLSKKEKKYSVRKFCKKILFLNFFFF